MLGTLGRLLNQLLDFCASSLEVAAKESSLAFRPLPVLPCCGRPAAFLLDADFVGAASVEEVFAAAVAARELSERSPGGHEALELDGRR